MRIDKYLWCVRIFKTRSLATKAVNDGWVRIEGQEVKASRDVKPNEIIEVRRLPIWRSYRVLAIPKSRVGAKLVADYLKEITTPEELEKYEVWQLSQKNNRAKGLGRPTKRERRDMERWKDI